VIQPLKARAEESFVGYAMGPPAVQADESAMSHVEYLLTLRTEESLMS